jgi:hypothetical protein
MALAAFVGPAAAAIPEDDFGWSAVHTNFTYELVDLNLADGLAPQVSVSESEFASFFSGEIGSIGLASKSIASFLGPNTRVNLTYTVDVTMQALDNKGSFVFLLYEDVLTLGDVGDLYGVYFQEGFSPETPEPPDEYTGAPIIGTQSFDASFRLVSGSAGEQFTIRLGATFFQGDRGTPLAPIPEPHTYVLMLAGLGGIGLLARRRRGGTPPADA